MYILDKLTAMLCCASYRVTDSSTEAFILRLYRQDNKVLSRLGKLLLFMYMYRIICTLAKMVYVGVCICEFVIPIMCIIINTHAAKIN